MTQDDNDLMWCSDEDEADENERSRARATTLAIPNGINDSSSDANDDDQSANEIVFGQTTRGRFNSRDDNREPNI